MPELDQSSAAIGELRGMIIGIQKSLDASAQGRENLHRRVDEIAAYQVDLGKNQALMAQTMDTMSRDVKPLKSEVEGFRGLRNKAVGALVVIGLCAGAFGSLAVALLPAFITKYFIAPH